MSEGNWNDEEERKLRHKLRCINGRGRPRVMEGPLRRNGLLGL